MLCYAVVLEEMGWEDGRVYTGQEEGRGKGEGVYMDMDMAC